MEKTLKIISRIGQFSGLLYESGNFSLTRGFATAGIIAAIARPGWPEIVLFGLALLNCAHERFERARFEFLTSQATETQELAKRVDELAKLQRAVEVQAAETKKQHDEMKKVISSSVLVNSFKPPTRRTAAPASTNVVG